MLIKDFEKFAKENGLKIGERVAESLSQRTLGILVEDEEPKDEEPVELDGLIGDIDCDSTEK